MTVKEQLTAAVTDLSDAEAQEVARFVRVLRLRSAVQRRSEFDESQAAAIYAEAAADDRELAEAGIDEYAHDLAAEDEL